MAQEKQVYPKPWWFRLAERWLPSRCREIPEATDPDRPFLRQVALWKARVYLQQFCSMENQDFFHTHPFAWGTIAIGLWGRLYEVRMTGVDRCQWWQAPYIRYMGRSFAHNSSPEGPGHTSIFIGLGKKTDEKFYYEEPPSIHWTAHIQRKVARL